MSSANKTVIWVPYRGDNGGWRDKNFAAVMPQVRSTAKELGAKVFVGDAVSDNPAEPFSIARTWNLLGEMSDDIGWDKAICWGADFLLVDPVTSLREALSRGGHYVFAFNKVSTLNRAQTLEVHRNGPKAFPQSTLPFGGVRVITRRLWETVGGYDPRFSGWGHEDRAHVHGVEILFGQRTRVPGHMLNLWHPKKHAAGHTEAEAAYFAHRRQNLEMLKEVQKIKSHREWFQYLAEREN